MRLATIGLLVCYVLCFSGLMGCQPATPPEAKAPAPPKSDLDGGDHGDEHGHDDDHDHADDHAHDDHDHADKHDHEHGDEHGHEHPETLAEAVAQIDKLVAKAAESFAAGAEDDADAAVHEVGHLLEDAEKMLEDAELDGKDVVKGAITDLFDAFNRIDEKIHGGEGSTYDEEKEKIATALATLKEKVTKTE